MEKIVEELQERMSVVEGALVSLEAALGKHDHQFAAILAKLESMGPCSGDSNASHDGSGLSTQEGNNFGAHMLVQTPKIEFPTFDGSDPIAWLAQAEYNHHLGTVYSRVGGTFWGQFCIVLGDGTRIWTCGVCKAVPFIISDCTFYITCYVFPLRSVDVILGVSWLAQLGDVVANWAKLAMQFEMAGETTMDSTASSTLEVSLEADVARKAELEALLALFPSVTLPLKGLPPFRSHDHHFMLQKGVPSISVRTYR
ncbi:hypothetical protein C2S52_005306 [Perilla frutescens var. hirtella]|nr:hypothetical protein C2S52_005306 [Perilla frutescens var. hirtella]